MLPHITHAGCSCGIISVSDPSVNEFDSISNIAVSQQSVSQQAYVVARKVISKVQKNTSTANRHHC